MDYDIVYSATWETFAAKAVQRPAPPIDGGRVDDPTRLGEILAVFQADPARALLVRQVSEYVCLPHHKVTSCVHRLVQKRALMRVDHGGRQAGRYRVAS